MTSARQFHHGQLRLAPHSGRLPRVLPPSLRSLRAAFTFLTRIPVGGFPYRDDDWRWTMAWFPVIGAMLGAVSALLLVLLREPLGEGLAAGVMLAVSMLLTGGFHEDGLADSADGLGGGYTKERVLEILKDSRIGTFGAAALMIALFLRGGASARLADVGQGGLLVFGSIVLGQCLSRLFAVLVAWRMPYVTSDAASRSRLVTRAGKDQAAFAAASTFAVGLVAIVIGGLGLQELLASVFIGGLTTLCCAWRFHVRAGGVTGDFLGATQQLSEIAILLTLVGLRSAA